MLTGEVEQYDSSQEGVATTFRTRMANLCAARPDVVFFAGRGVDLTHFLAPLKDRPCSERKLVVFSGDDASEPANAAGYEQIKETLRTGTVRLVYTGLAHPGSWQKAKDAFPGSAVQSFEKGGRYRSAFPGEPLGDGQAMMAHDAVLTAVSGIRLDVSDVGGRVTGSEIIQRWTSLHGLRSVKGASGLICLGNDGSPQYKAVPIIETEPDGTVRALGVSASSGTPLKEKDVAEGSCGPLPGPRRGG
jgi:hypothetical protein